jgi:hypothetical protein
MFHTHIKVSSIKVKRKGNAVPVLNQLSTTPITYMEAGCIDMCFLTSALLGGE